MPIGTRQRVEHVTVDAVSTSTLRWAASSPSYWISGGAPSRSAAICVCASPRIGRCGCAIKASMPLSTNQIRATCGHHGWRRTATHRYAPVEITAAHISISSAGEAAIQQPMLTIHDRPFPPVDRSEPGHWEGDLLIGDNHLSAIGTLVERRTRMLRLVHLPRADSDSLHAALVARMQDLPPVLMRSITWDQGTEMVRHLATADKQGAPVYFCDSRSPWQRGSNENTNDLLRGYFPKGVTLRGHSPEHLLAVEDELNNRPRRVLQDRCPADLFATLLASRSPSVLRR